VIRNGGNMNKKLIAALSAAALMTAGASAALADDEITVNLDGKAIPFDVAPIIENDRTLVPLRAIFEALGAQVDWDGTTQTVISVKGDRTCVFQIANSNMFVTTTIGQNASVETKTLDVPAKIKDDRTLIPLRAVSEAYSCNVDWDGATRTVNITSPSAE
jgi:N-acetylmuramoyl-L-alanine amidase